MPGSTARLQRKTLLRLVARTSSHASSVVVRTSPNPLRPAMLHRMSMRPKRSSAAAVSASTSARAADVRGARPDLAAVQRGRLAGQRSPSMSVSTRLAPSAANSAAVARPMPDAAPVIIHAIFELHEAPTAARIARLCSAIHPPVLWMRANTGWLMMARQVLKKPFAFMPVQYHLDLQTVSRRGRTRATTSRKPKCRGSSPSEITPAEFQRHAREHGPLVIEGLALDSEACKQWTVELLPQELRRRRAAHHQSRSVDRQGADARAARRHPRRPRHASSTSRTPPTSSTSVPSSRRSCRSRRSGRCVGPLGKYSGSQLFLGGKNTGTRLPLRRQLQLLRHGAGREGMAVRRRALQRVDVSVHAAERAVRVFAGAAVRADAASSRSTSAIPKLRTRLKPGDVLVNPPWWWHAVKNVTPTTIAVATRWVTGSRALEQPLLRLPELPVERRRARATPRSKRASG